MNWQTDINQNGLPSISNEMKDWEDAVSSHKRFKRITADNQAYFFARLGKEADLDTYGISPVYYTLTGRKGLWIYQNGNSFIPLCWHPNVEGQILVFPPRGEDNSDIMKQLLSEIPVPPVGIRLARISDSDLTSTWLNKISGNEDRTIQLLQVKETVLDWLYPVRIPSTEAIAKLKGREFMKIRNSIKQAQRNKIEIEQLSIGHLEKIKSFAYRWANQRAQSMDELMALLEPYKRIIDLFNYESFNLDGLVFSIEGSIQAVTIWEKPNTAKKAANIWMSLSDTTCKGISELAMWETAKALHEEGISLINFGGSETKGLDDYKRKYIPKHSVNLHSIEAIVEGTDLIFNTLMQIREKRIAA